jgi:hypothetical protein
MKTRRKPQKFEPPFVMTGEDSHGNVRYICVRQPLWWFGDLIKPLNRDPQELWTTKESFERANAEEHLAHLRDAKRLADYDATRLRKYARKAHSRACRLAYQMHLLEGGTGYVAPPAMSEVIYNAMYAAREASSEMLKVYKADESLPELTHLRKATRPMRFGKS